MATSQDVSIIRILLELGEEDFKVFKVYLCEYKSFPWSQLDKADRADTSVKMKETYPETALEIIINILKDINRNDLVQRFSPTGSPTNGISYRPADNNVFHSPPSPGPAARWIAERREEIVSHMTEACLNQSLDALLARQLLMVEDYELVQGRPTRTAKVRQLLDTCGRHGEGFCRVVVRKLQDNRQLRLQPFPSGLCSPFHSETSRCL